MAPVEWTELGRPGEVLWARATGDAAVIAVGTIGGHLYLRRRTATAWRWEHVGTPPGAVEVLDAALLDAALLDAEGSGDIAPVVVGDDLRVWLYRPEATPTPWISLAGPAPDVGLDHFADCGDIVVSTSRRGAALRHLLVVSSASGRPWIRQGIDPDATWFRIASEEDWIAAELATVFASDASGSEPQRHIFAVVKDRESFVSRLRIGVHEDLVWTWVDPGLPPPGDLGVQALSATSFRDGDGRLQACAIVRTFATDNVSMVIGSGRDWRWVDLEHPGFHGISEAVVAAKGPDPRPGDEPVIVARATPGHHIWTRSLTSGWTDLGTTPQDVAVVNPTAAFEVAATDGQKRVWTTGVSWESDLWTFESDDAGVRWEAHGCPGSVISVVGAYTDTPNPDVSDLPVAVYIIDENGAVWGCQRWGNLADGFSHSSSSWTYHGRPAADVTSAEGVGVLTMTGSDPQPAWVFVVGSDGHLWARTADANGWAWIDHGAPTGRSVKTGVAPIMTDLGDGLPTVHVQADDGRLWTRSMAGGDWRWSDLGAPPGQLIFVIVGAAAHLSAAGALPVAAAVTGDGHLWINVSDGASFRWSDLGTPAPAEKIVTGIGIEAVAESPDAGALDIVVVGSPSGEVWSHRWVRGGPPRWTAHGRPADARIRANIGTIPDPANSAGCLVSVIGNDQQVWVTASAAPGGAWSRWDPQLATTTIVGGKATVLLDALPCVLVLDKQRRVHVVTPERG